MWWDRACCIWYHALTLPSVSLWCTVSIVKYILRLQVDTQTLFCRFMGIFTVVTKSCSFVLLTLQLFCRIKKVDREMARIYRIIQIFYCWTCSIEKLLRFVAWKHWPLWWLIACGKKRIYSSIVLCTKILGRGVVQNNTTVLSMFAAIWKEYLVLE